MSRITKTNTVFAGQNPGARWSTPQGDPLAAVSYWWCDLSEYGPGQVLALVMRADPSAEAQALVLSDNPDLARFLIGSFTRHFKGFEHALPETFEVVEAAFGMNWDGREYVVEARADQQRIDVTWSEVGAQQLLLHDGYEMGGRLYDLTTVLCSCAAVNLSVGGEGLVQPDLTGSTLAGWLAFAETWGLHA